MYTSLTLLYITFNVGKKGHHDKEDHKKSYHEEDGHKKKHHDEG